MSKQRFWAIINRNGNVVTENGWGWVYTTKKHANDDKRLDMKETVAEVEIKVKKEMYSVDPSSEHAA